MENNFDKETEDLGWEKMLALLDKEKPVIGMIPPQYIDQKFDKNGSLRKRWALAALLFLSIAGCGIWSYQLFKNKPSIQEFVTIEKTVNTENKAQNLPSISQNTEGGKSNLTQQLNSDNADISTPNKSKSLLNKNKITIQNVDNQSITESKQENSIVKNANEEVEKIGDRQLIEAINPLDLEALIDSIESISERYPIINLMENTAKMPQKWQFGLTLGAHTEGVKPVDGYQIGLVLNRQLTQKWAFSTGLNYRNASTKSRGNASFLAANQSSTSAGVTTPSSSFNLSKVVDVRLEDMQYLELPVMMDYWVNKRLSVFSGLKMSYLLSKNWVRIDTTNANLFVITYGNQSNKVADLSSNLYNKFSSNSVNNSLDFAVIGGIKYRLSHHFDVSVRYDFGLKNIFKQNNASVYNRYLGLNVNYYFK